MHFLKLQQLIQCIVLYTVLLLLLLSTQYYGSHLQVHPNQLIAPPNFISAVCQYLVTFPCNIKTTINVIAYIYHQYGGSGNSCNGSKSLSRSRDKELWRDWLIVLWRHCAGWARAGRYTRANRRRQRDEAMPWPWKSRNRSWRLSRGPNNSRPWRWSAWGQ